MALIDPDAPDNSFAYLDEASVLFMRAIKQHYTRDTAVEALEALTPILGKDWKARLIFGIVSNKNPQIRNVRILVNIAPKDVQKIIAIREVRRLSGLGLTEAKNLVESAYTYPRDVTVYETHPQYDRIEWAKAIEESIKNLQNAGFKVEFL